MTVDETIALMAENWFLREPVFYSLFCRLERRENAAMACPVRVGQGRLEYNPLLLGRLNYRDTEQQFRVEMIRLLLRHPYQRRPEGCSDEIVGIGSNITIGDNYCFLHTPDRLPVQTPEAYHLPLGMHYEWYCRELSRQQNDSQQPDTQESPQSSPSRGQSDTQNGCPEESQRERFRALVELWQEDELLEEQINMLIDSTDDWGDMPAELVSRIRAAAARRIPRGAILDGFRASVLGSRRLLTRLRPNRRTGWSQMGSRREYMAQILVAVDVSCSVSDRDVASFLATVERLFSYGVCHIDWMTFDTEVRTVSSHRPGVETEITGRGGTNFQPVLDYAIGLSPLATSPVATSPISSSPLASSPISSSPLATSPLSSSPLSSSPLASSPLASSPHASSPLARSTYDGLIILTDGHAPAPVWRSHHHPHLLWALTTPQYAERLHTTGRVLEI